MGKIIPQHIKHINKPPKVISLFSGAGGMDIGFEAAGFEIAVAVEYDPSCCQTLRKNKPNLPVIEGDITKIDSAEILNRAGLEPLEAGLVIGGPPCQSFSLAGKRLGMDEPRGRLVLEFIKKVREILPVAFVMENVKGMTNWQGGAALKAIEEALAEPIIYNGETYHYVMRHKVLDAADYGAPQFRERVFIVGNRIGKDFSFPDKTHGLRDEQASLFKENEIRDYVTVIDAIGKLPEAEGPSEVAKRVSETIKDRIKKHGY